MKLKLFQIDAFADTVFSGNPAAVIILAHWLPDQILQKIAEENNLSETAFLVLEDGIYRLRWFTPAREVDLCGHATLAAAFVLFNEMGEKNREVEFNTKSGMLKVKNENESLVLNFPAIQNTHEKITQEHQWLVDQSAIEIYSSSQDLMVVLASETDVSNFIPDFRAIRSLNYRGLIVTSGSQKYDFVSRTFYPEISVDEDPVTGSAHCQMAPYWAEKLGKNKLRAKQISNRGGEIICWLEGDRVCVQGKAVKYLEGVIEIGNTC